MRWALLRLNSAPVRLCLTWRPRSHRSLTYSHQLITLLTLSLAVLTNTVNSTAAVDTTLNKRITSNEAALSNEPTKSAVTDVFFSFIVSAHFQGRLSVLFPPVFCCQRRCGLLFSIGQKTTGSTLMHGAEKTNKEKADSGFHWYLCLGLVSNCARREDDRSSCPNVANSSLLSPVGLRSTEVNYWAHKYVNRAE